MLDDLALAVYEGRADDALCGDVARLRLPSHLPEADGSCWPTVEWLALRSAMIHSGDPPHSFQNRAIPTAKMRAETMR
jgi:hypothetical protein